ncbi:MAG TPA: TPM domain-containing protein [Solirubrobacterales bacterium]|nr:TPM domain-containing protein [Solirubrobacterales bacterium]
MTGRIHPAGRYAAAMYARLGGRPGTLRPPVSWRRAARLLAASAALAALLAILLATRLLAAGPPFPEPILNQAVYDPADAIRPATEARLEEQIDAIEQRSGAEIVVYLQVKPGISEEENLNDAHALMDQWGVGRSGYDDGLVILFGLDESRRHGRVSLYGGSGFLAAYIDENALAEIIDRQIVPAASAGDIDAALLDAMDAIDARITAGGRDRLERLRQVNAVLGLVVAPLVLIGLAGVAFLRWRREGDDPEYLDSPSILMAGPPADMTPPLATVVRQGRATQHTIDTVLVELASRGRLAFVNLDRVRKVHRDSSPDPLLDPAIVVPATTAADDRPLAAPQALAEETIRRLSGSDGRLTREPLWSLNTSLSPVKARLEADALQLGWFTRLPGPAITRWTALGIAELVFGVIVGVLGLVVPMSGALLLGGALALAGLITVGFGQAMSKRTPNGAMVDAMLKAYRRTLEKTLEQARSMGEVVADETVRILADTPDKAVVWGFALGLHRQVAEVIERGLADQREGRTSEPAYYPYWLGSSGGAQPVFAGSAGGASVFPGSGSAFSGSPIPDFGGMFSALGGIGSAPPSSSSGGGFGGGGGGGGGGASGSF